MPSGRSAIPFLVLITAVLGACAEEKITYYRPMFSGLPGVESTTPITDAKPRGAVDAPPPSEVETLSTLSPDRKQTHLTARTARHVMIHIYHTLTDDDEALFLDQVLSTRTKDEYYDRGMEPRDAFVLLKENFAEVKKLFDAMPMGEFTPGMYLEPVGPNILRLEVHGRAAQGLSWTGFDIIREGADYRLRWFTGKGPKASRQDETITDEPEPVVIGPKRE